MNTIKLSIVLYTQGLEFNGDSIKEKSLGGSETALLLLARELAALGHYIKIFCNCDKPGVYDKVEYFHYDDFDVISPMTEPDVLIVSRFANVFSSLNLKSGLNILWNHDTYTPRSGLNQIYYNVDINVCLSQFHLNNFKKHLPGIENITWVSRNGVDFDLVDKTLKKVTAKNKDLYVYSSRPERGLEPLLKKYWPILKKLNPNAELAICGYDLGNFPIAPEMTEFYKNIDNLIAKTEGVTVQPKYTKEKWYEFLAGAGFLIYPTAFPEISCLTAIEAQALGTPIITTDNFALSETVKDKRLLVEGDCETNEYIEEYFSKLKMLYEDTKLYRDTVKIGKDWVRNEAKYDWKVIAKEWETKIFDFLKNRYETKKRQVATQLFYSDDQMLCKEVLSEIDKKDDNKFPFDIRTQNERVLSYGENPGILDAEKEYFKTLLENIKDKKGLPVVDQARFEVSFSIIEDYMKDNKNPIKFLDSGGYWGPFGSQIASIYPNIYAVNLDFNEYSIGKGKEIFNVFFKPEEGTDNVFKFDNGSKFELQLGKIEDVEDNTYDIIFAGEFVEHFKDYVYILNQLSSKCKKDGIIILTLPDGPWGSAGNKFLTKDEQAPHMHCFHYQDLLEIFFEQDDFKITTVHAHTNKEGRECGNWVISWKNNPDKKFRPINTERKKLVTRPYQWITAGMIIKNEEDNITGCIKSYAEYVDDIVICDTGSTDKTKDLIETLKNKYNLKPRITVYDLKQDDPKTDPKIIKQWGEGDFGYWRNECLKNASYCDWFFWIDADERLQWPLEMRKFVWNGGGVFEGFIIKQHQLTIDVKEAKYEAPVRLFRNDRDYKFYGVIHEQSQTGLNEVIFPYLVLPDTKIAHYGYMNEQLRRRKVAVRNLKLLMKDRIMNPNRKLGLVLLQRDYINLIGWEFATTNFKLNKKIIDFCRQIVLIYKEEFEDKQVEFKDNPHLLDMSRMAYQFYQTALKHLNSGYIPAIKESDEIPFEAAITIVGDKNGIDNNIKANIIPQFLWFRDEKEFKNILKENQDKLLKSINIKRNDEYI